MFRPQYVSDPAAVVFTSRGNVTINGNPGDWAYHGAGRVDNQGMLTINGTSVNFNTIDNSGTLIINAELSNFGTINNTGTIQINCGGSLTGSGTVTGNPVQNLCAPTNTPTSTPTNTAVPPTNTPTNTPISGPNCYGQAARSM